MCQKSTIDVGINILIAVGSSSKTHIFCEFITRSYHEV